MPEISPYGLAETSHPIKNRNGRSIQSIRRWLRAVAVVLDTDAAILVLSEGGISRVLTDFGITHPFAVADVPRDTIPYRWDETFIVLDARERADLHLLLNKAALERTGFFFRIPVLVEEKRTIGLIAYGREPHKPIPEQDMALVRDIAHSIRVEIETILEKMLDPLAAGSVPLDRSSLLRSIARADTAVALLDHNLTILAISDPLLAIRNKKREDLVGHQVSPHDIPALESFFFFFQKALENGTSTPDIEVALSGLGPDGMGTGNFSVIGTPILPLQGKETMLLVTVEDITERMNALDHLEARLPEKYTRPADATVDFLEETLVPRNALRSRNGIMYITFRSWRATIRAHQIRALKALKRSAPDMIASRIADEMEIGIRALIGVRAFYAVVPMPCGHSPANSCLSRDVAHILGRKLALPVIDALYLPRSRGSSHPKTNITRPPLRLAHSVPGPVLLVDDVATSGQHLEEASLLLRPSAGAVLALAWIGGDANQSEDEFAGTL